MDFAQLSAQLDHCLEALEIEDADEARQTAFNRFGQLQRDIEATAHRYRLAASVATARQGEAASLSNLVSQLGNHAADAIRARGSQSAAWNASADSIRRKFRDFQQHIER
jgi:hypothetical protein